VPLGGIIRQRWNPHHFVIIILSQKSQEVSISDTLIASLQKQGHEPIVRNTLPAISLLVPHTSLSGSSSSLTDPSR
jgi:hypothetical protein